MSKRFGLTVLFVLSGYMVWSQQMLNYPEVDKTSYELFQQEKWIGLIDYANKAREQGIDFFYLQVRTGIAYYNMKRYRQASTWLLKAWDNDKSFDWLQEYLYYSLIFGGRYSEASKIAGVFSPEMQDKIGFSDNQILRVALEGGFSFNPRFEGLSAKPHGQQAGVGEDYGEAFYLRNYHFESLDLSHRISPGLTLNHNFTYIGVNREEKINWGSVNQSFPINLIQLQYFLNPHFVIGKKIYFSPSISAIVGNYEYFAGRFTNNQAKAFYSSSVTYSDFILSASAWSHFGNFAPGGELNLATINNESIIQASGWITWYPLSNVNFYLTPRIYFRGDNENGFSYNTISISGGTRLGFAHIYGNYMNGEMENFIESGGYVVANFPGISKNKFSGSIYLPTGKKYQFVLRFISQDITENYLVYTNGVKNRELKYKYVKNTITAGISWNF